MTLANFNLVPPPRRVPVALGLALFLGGAAARLRWGILGFILLFFWAFGLPSDLYAVFRYLGPKETTTGKISKVSFRRGTGGMWAYHFEFATLENRKLKGVSYAPRYTAGAGARVKVSYKASDPAAARIVGMSDSSVGVFPGLLITLFALCAFVPVFLAIRTGIVARRILAHGKYAWGKLHFNRATRLHVYRGTWKGQMEGGQLRELIFEFKPEGEHRPHWVGYKTPFTQPFEEAGGAAILYDSIDPRRQAMLVEAIPCSLTFDPSGNLTFSIQALVKVLLVPALVLVVHGVIVGLMIFR